MRQYVSKVKSTENTDRASFPVRITGGIYMIIIYYRFLFIKYKMKKFLKFMILKKIEIQILLLTYRLRNAMIQEK